MPGSESEKVSSKANALILFNPVLRFGPQLLKKIDNDEAVGKAISPILHLAKDSPPTLLFYGTDDWLLKQGEEFIQRSKELGHRAEMFTADKQPHGFFHKSPWREKTLQRTDEFLVSLGYLQGKPTIKVPDAKDAEKPKPIPIEQIIPKITSRFGSVGQYRGGKMPIFKLSSLASLTGKIGILPPRKGQAAFLACQ